MITGIDEQTFCFAIQAMQACEGYIPVVLGVQTEDIEWLISLMCDVEGDYEHFVAKNDGNPKSRAIGLRNLVHLLQCRVQMLESQVVCN